MKKKKKNTANHKVLIFARRIRIGQENNILEFKKSIFWQTTIFVTILEKC